MKIDLPLKYRYTYKLAPRFGNWGHVWKLIGRWGGLHLHITDFGAEHAEKYGDRYSAGLEVHYRVPPKHMNDQPPSFDHCDLIECPCWHDGTSLYPQENILPIWLISPNDHEGMFRLLARYADERFAEFDRTPEEVTQ